MALGEYAYEVNKDGESLNLGDGKSLTQTSTRPIQILCHIRDKSANDFIEPFDINICPDENGDRLKVKISSDLKTLPAWYDKLNHVNDQKYKNIREPFKVDNQSKDFNDVLKIDNYRVYGGAEGEKEEISLLSLTFQLNQLLMLINNPILFPHMAYVKMFNDEFEPSDAGANVKLT